MPKTVKRRKNKLAGRYRNRWPDEAEISGRMIPKWVADSCRNRWPDHPEICTDWKLSGGKETPTYSNTMTKFFCRNKGSKGNPDSGLVVRLGLNREGRNFTFHGLRKTLINAAYHTGVPLEKLQAIVGHGTDLFKTYKLPKNHISHSDATFGYIQLDSIYSPDIKAALTDLKTQIDSVNFGYSLAGINWQAWRKSKTKKGLKA